MAPDHMPLGPPIGRSNLEMDPNGSVIWKNESPAEANSINVIQSPQPGPSTASRPGSPSVTIPERPVKSKRFLAFIHLLNLIKKSSYAGTLIVMMVSF